MSTSRPFAGSSPLVRGTRISLRSKYRLYRFIPAGAGNTPLYSCTMSRTPVHPRWCGEHDFLTTMWLNMCGSSPLVRGTRPAHFIPSGNGRFIPAGAGNTQSLRVIYSGLFGSSPLVRGTLHSMMLLPAHSRFIPAGAGNTRPNSPKRINGPVHPRWCGEHAIAASCSRPPGGSSPLVRGTPLLIEYLPCYKRFIPAGAGNTYLAPIPIPPRPVHPRWCGEHRRVRHTGHVPAGSSPLVRGTRKIKRWQKGYGRFIPAGAGNTGVGLPGGGRVTVHPRWCGEHMVTALQRSRVSGSSPLVRGTHTAISSAMTFLRFIPAGAGNTSSSFNGL